MGKSKELATLTDAGGTIDGDLTATGTHTVGSPVAYGKLRVKGDGVSGYTPTSFNGGGNNTIRLESGGSPTWGDTAGLSIGLSGSAEAYIGAVQNANGYADVVMQTYDGYYAERMRIDASGRVTMPYQPMAHVWNAAMGDIGTIIFRSVSLNQGGHYNTSTGLFTCPISGVYRVSWHFMKENYQTVPAYMEGRLVVNGAALQYARSYSYTSTADYGNHGTSILYYASQGDSLGVYTNATGGVFDNGYSHASFELVG